MKILLKMKQKIKRLDVLTQRKKLVAVLVNLDRGASYSKENLQEIFGSLFQRDILDFSQTA